MELLNGKDVAFFAHPDRPEASPFTVFDEIDLALRRNTCDKRLLKEQRNEYKRISKEHIYYGAIIIRKNTQKTNRLFEEWWAEYCRYPTRDQLSLFKVFRGKAEIITRDLADYAEHSGHN